MCGTANSDGRATRRRQRSPPVWRTPGHRTRGPRRCRPTARAATPERGCEIEGSLAKAARFEATLSYGSFATGNAEGGLTTIEETSLGAYAKSGSSPIAGLVEPGDVPPRDGLCLLDVVADGEVRFGFPAVNGNAEIAGLIACESRPVLFVTRCGCGIGSLAGGADLRQSRNRQAHARGYGRRCLPDSGRRR